ncbi:hypothetical protein L211DRAFT_837585 [Terfezia boudieri ATCC MYA-4762]|uniref:Uncharacterized protein n=1 Tax=Terfezia boudieri ATCC MYA-4762 TaxID=1051890 RepID=A0A3N4LTV8_9PEZI|nr:hypothetical protein L211DRAFT_837585 [Terfezia boudieri ATCC MYA-4762]
MTTTLLYRLVCYFCLPPLTSSNLAHRLCCFSNISRKLAPHEANEDSPNGSP